MSDVYEGRLVADGNGNLLADERKQVGTKQVTVTDAEGETILDSEGNALVIEVPIFKFGKNHGQPVVYDKDADNFRFLKPGEPSHNEQHHENFAGVVATQADDPDQPGYAGTREKPTEGNEHHFGILPDDAHYHEGGGISDETPNTRLRTHPDKHAVRISGHTHQHKVGE